MRQRSQRYSALFTHYESIQTDAEKAEKVSNTIVRQLGNETWYRIGMAMVSCYEDRADVVYHTIVLGLQLRDKKITDRLQEDCVQRTFQCARASENELCHLKQFLRFSELQNGMLYAKINTKHHVLPHLMPHFADRLPADNFVIYDENTQTFGLHASYKKWYLMQGQILTRTSWFILSLRMNIRSYSSVFVKALQLRRV